MRLLLVLLLEHPVPVALAASAAVIGLWHRLIGGFRWADLRDLFGDDATATRSAAPPQVVDIRTARAWSEPAAKGFERQPHTQARVIAAITPDAPWGVDQAS